MRVLGGLIVPDGGRVEVDGRDVTGWGTAEAIGAGVGMVHQHFMLVPTLTVAENVVLGHEPSSGVRFDRARARREVQALCEQSGHSVPVDALVADLSVGAAQRVEILKTLYRGARLLLLDEPTAVLSPLEVAELWKTLRRLRDAGTTIVLITHKLDEVMDLSENITVMRQGQTVARMATRETTPAEIAHAMVGRDVSLPARTAHPAMDGRAALEVENLVVRGARVERAVDDVSFSIAAGEILGIAGVEGNGQTELVEAIAGLRHATSGRVRLGGVDVTARDVRARSDAGLAHIPEDRQCRGLVLDYSVADNLILGRQRHYSKRGVLAPLAPLALLAPLDRTAISVNAEEQISAFDIRPASPDVAVRTLSGGNQQKIVLARELSRPFTALIAAQPTRGVDVGAIERIHGELLRVRDAGKAMLLVSADLRELLALSDRIAVLYKGKLVVVMPRSAASEEVLGPYMTGAKREAVA